MWKYVPGLPVLFFLPVSACSDLPARPRPMPPHEVTITAGDFSFRAPDSIPAGLTRIRLYSEGRERHHAQLAKLERGRTMAELLDSLTRSRGLPSWVTFVGGPNVPPPSGPSEILVSLEAGSYALLCFVTTADGVPHLAKGMMRELTVLAGPALDQPVPSPDVRLVLDDYGFELSPALQAGYRVVRADKRGQQPHEVLIVRLAPGKTAADLMEWIKDEEGPPPGETFGGAMALQPGQLNHLRAEFTAGDYVLLCFVPDSGDGKPHVAHGMIRQIRVN